MSFYGGSDACAVFAGVGDVRTDERDLLHGGGVLRFVLPDQFDVGRGGPELRRRSGNHARGTSAVFLINRSRDSTKNETAISVDVSRAAYVVAILRPTSRIYIKKRNVRRKI